jgi:hypothetical protein
MDVEETGEESEPEPMDVEDDAVYAQQYDADMDVSGPDKEESEKLANEDWKQLSETSKASSNQETFVREATKTYQKAKRSDYVKECRTGVQQRRREWRKAQKQKENRQMPATPPTQEEAAPRSRLTQVWWLENGIQAVHYYYKKALGELRVEMADMQNVKTHQYAILSADKESVTMIPIRKNMPVSPASTEALTAVVTVVPCIKVGENCYMRMRTSVMEDHTAEDLTRQEMVHT